jgi:hypothetical protein
MLTLVAEINIAWLALVKGVWRSNGSITDATFGILFVWLSSNLLQLMSLKASGMGWFSSILRRW